MCRVSMDETGDGSPDDDHTDSRLDYLNDDDFSSAMAAEVVAEECCNESSDNIIAVGGVLSVDDSSGEVMRMTRMPPRMILTSLATEPARVFGSRSRQLSNQIIMDFHLVER